MLDGLYQSIVCFFVPYFVFSLSVSISGGAFDFSRIEFGTTVAACAVTAANLFVGLHIRYWTWMVFVIVIGSIAIFHLWITIYSQFPVFDFGHQIFCSSHRNSSFFSKLTDCTSDLYTTLPFWTSVVLCQIIAIGPRFFWRYFQSAYFPLDADIIREMEVLGKGTHDLEGASKEYGFDPPSPTDSEAPHHRDRSDDTGFNTAQFDLNSPTKESLMPERDATDPGWQYSTIAAVDRTYGAQGGEKRYDDNFEEETFDAGYRRSSSQQGGGYAV